MRKRAGKITLDPHIQHSRSLNCYRLVDRAMSTRMTRHRNSFFPHTIHLTLDIKRGTHNTIIQSFIHHTYFLFSNLHISDLYTHNCLYYILWFPFKLSRDITEITPLWETPSLQPFLKTYWLTPVNDWPIVAKHANMTSSRGSINAAPATIRQNLFLHLAEPRLWLKMLQLTVKVRLFEGRPHGCSSAAFRWVWHFLKVVRLPSDQRWTFGTQVMSSCRLKVRIPLTVEPAGQDISPASHAPLPWRCGEPRADAGAKGSHVAADAARKNPLCKHAAPASERRSAVCKAQSLLSHSHDNTFTW